jgi:hypothetical protein
VRDIRGNGVELREERMDGNNKKKKLKFLATLRSKQPYSKFLACIYR